MNAFDVSVAQAINSFVGTYRHLDAGIYFVSHSDLLKGGVLTPLVWLLWAGKDNASEARRKALIALVWACFFALMTSRLLASTLPFRVRPIHEPDLGLHLAHSMPSITLDSWSSLPSDHAALFMAFAGGLYFVSRRIGCIALIYTLILILLPRLYLGLHYPTDLLLGACIGLASAWACRRPEVEPWIVAPVIALYDKRPGLVLAAIFVVTAQISVMFEPLLDVVKFSRGVVNWSLMHHVVLRN